MIRAIVVAGVSSGVGKTTLTIGLSEAFRRRGLTVQAFKVGPDFIDPGFHTLVTGRPSYNLDGWMCPRDRVLCTVARRAHDTDLALIEGVMGCFDGAHGTSEEGSTAQIARWLGAPVVLVMDAGALARSAGAVVLGFERFDPELNVVGVIFNRVANESHFRWLRESMEGHCRSIPLGFLPHHESFRLPDRHLGLVTASERGLARAFVDELVEAIEAHVDLENLLAVARSSVRPRGEAMPDERGGGPTAPAKVKIGVARDRAFQFYYQANFDLLRAAGAELVFWSPLQDPDLPDVDALYLGGGYPEVYARELSGNVSMLEGVREFADRGRPIYGECGGLMYLAERMEDLEGVEHPMVGLLPTTVRMKPNRLMLGYTEVEVTRETPLAKAGTIVRGHEFHASRIEAVPDWVPRAYSVRTGPGEVPRAEGYLVRNALLSYVHLHFGSNPAVAEHLVASCRTRSDA
ncbi:MAG: cobyrinate a,c-diamide synthase [Candidatus Methylomirabilia bacterium]